MRRIERCEGRMVADEAYGRMCDPCERLTSYRGWIAWLASRGACRSTKITAVDGGGPEESWRVARERRFPERQTRLRAK